MQATFKSHFIVFIWFACYALLVFVCEHHAFFYDTTQLGSMHAHFYLDTHFTQLIPPATFDSGHIPTFGLYLAAVWWLVGKSLAVSHWCMFPFMCGIIWQAYLLLNKFLYRNYIPYALSVLLLEPTLVAQCSLVSPDIILVFFFLLGINAVLSNSRKLLLVAALGLFCISMRGMMCCFALALFDVFICNTTHHNRFHIRSIIQLGWVYLPAVAVFFIYTLYHYRVAGWVGYHAASPWAACFAPVGWAGALRNIGIIGWRMLDFGRLFIWITLALLTFQYLHKNKKITWVAFKQSINTNNLNAKLLILTILIISCLSYSGVRYANLTNHRYFIPIYLCITLCLLRFMQMQWTSKGFKTTTLLLMLGLASGHLWQYPTGVAMGWDCTLAHLPYYQLRTDALQYIQNHNFKMTDVGATFPMLGTNTYLDVSTDTSQLVNYENHATPYVLYTNIGNAFTDEDIQRFDNQYETIWEEKKVGIFMKMLKKK